MTLKTTGHLKLWNFVWLLDALCRNWFELIFEMSYAELGLDSPQKLLFPQPITLPKTCPCCVSSYLSGDSCCGYCCNVLTTPSHGSVYSSWLSRLQSRVAATRFRKTIFGILLWCLGSSHCDSATDWVLSYAVHCNCPCVSDILTRCICTCCSPSGICFLSRQ